MVLLRIRVYPEPVRSRKLCHKWSIFPCYSATAWVPFGQCIHFLLDPYSPSFYSLYIPKRVARKNHEQALRHPPPFHCFARPLAGGGGICARFSRAPNKRVGPFRCAGIHPASPHTGGMPSGFRRGCSILQVKSSAAGPGHTSGGVHLSPCPSSDACVLSSPSAPALHGAASCPSPFPHLPFDPLPFVVCAPRVRASRAFPFPGIACGQVAKSHAKHSSCRVQRMGREGRLRG